MFPNLTHGSPLAASVASVIQPKLVEMGWSNDDGQESALIEYIVLMLVSGKTQEQLATELSNDFLGLDEGDTQALEFSGWLFGQVESLDRQINGGGQDESAAIEQSGQDSSQPERNEQDADMDDAGYSM